jgi:hypothetical protein
MTLDIDFEVYKALTGLRRSENDSYNSVLRRMLKLPESSPVEEQSAKPDFITKGYRFPDGTVLRAAFKGKEYRAEIKDGSISYAGKNYGSFSAAAKAVTSSQRNGWDFWECRLPGSEDWSRLY